MTVPIVATLAPYLPAPVTASAAISELIKARIAIAETQMYENLTESLYGDDRRGRYPAVGLFQLINSYEEDF